MSGHEQQTATAMRNDIWGKARDVVTVLLIPAVVWLNTQTQRNAETTYALTAAQAQIKENRANIVELRRDYNSLHIQIVELKGTLRAIQDTLGALSTQIDGVDQRIRSLESNIILQQRSVQGAQQPVAPIFPRAVRTPAPNGNYIYQGPLHLKDVSMDKDVEPGK
jgi:septal ring factor EnvC (AmiA/AmiB activator)